MYLFGRSPLSAFALSREILRRFALRARWSAISAVFRSTCCKRSSICACALCAALSASCAASCFTLDISRAAALSASSFRAWLYRADLEASHIPALFELHGYTHHQGYPMFYSLPFVSLRTRCLIRLPSKAADIVVRYNTDSIMPQRLAADQHSSLVQLLARFILAASVDVTLISFSGSFIHPVKRNFTDLSCMSFVDSNCVI